MDLDDRKFSGSPEVLEVGATDLPAEKAGTVYDQKDMARVGKQQELRRNFRFISILGFTAVLMSTWEAVLITAGYGLTNGGLAGLVWMYLITVVGFGAAILSMAEMASMAPTSGGQYHWVSEFAPRSGQKFLSFVTGWLCVLGWQVNIASGGYIIATMITGLLTMLNPENYAYQPWHGTLIIIAVNIVSIVFNTFFARKLPLIEGLILILHVCGFFAILIPLWVFSPRTPAATVFTDFENNGGWSSTALACLVGMTGPVYALIGPDSAVHMCTSLPQLHDHETARNANVWAQRKKLRTPRACSPWACSGPSCSTAPPASSWSSPSPSASATWRAWARAPRASPSSRSSTTRPSPTRAPWS